MTRLIHALLVAVLAMAADVSAAGIDCPPGADQVDARIMPSVEYDGARQVHIYRYTVRNLQSSQQRVEGVTIKVPNDEVRDVRYPDGWWGSTASGFGGEPQFVDWYAVRVANRNEPSDGTVEPSTVAIDPGNTLSGFVIESPLPPGPKSLYITGEVRIESVSGEREMERLWEQCETVRQSFLEAAKEVPTVGPVEGDFQPVGIDIHPGSDENPVNPKKKGVIPVAILGSSDFDLSQLDTATLTFGPGGAPVANRGHQRRDVDGDGITDRVVHFDARSAGIECHDTLAFVRGETVGGEAVQGFDPLTTPGCRGRK